MTITAGSMPTYPYRPSTPGEFPKMRTKSFIRARLWQKSSQPPPTPVPGEETSDASPSVYFRAKEPSMDGNLISVGVVKIGSAGTFNVTYHKSKISELVHTNDPSSKVKLSILDATELDYNEMMEFERESDSSLLRAFYSISLQIAPGDVPVTTRTDKGLVRIGQAFAFPGILSGCFTDETVLAPGDIITVKPRIQSYPLTWTTVTVPSPDPLIPGTSYSGWDIDALRTLVNARAKLDGWIEMMPRAMGQPPNSAPVIPPPDVQDEGYDSYVMDTFKDTYLTGGDGLPEIPDGERTGPSRSIIHINYGEVYNGFLAVVNVVYEWTGDNHINGEWLDLFRDT